MYLNICSAWMIYKVGITSRRYLIMFEIFAVAHSRAFVSLLYSLLVRLDIFSAVIVFVSARFASCFLTFQLIPAN